MTRFAPLWQQAGSYPSVVDRGLLSALWPGGGGAGPAPSTVANTMNVTIPPGWLAVPLQSGQGSALCRWDAPEVVPLTASPPSGQQRWDAVVCQVRDNAIDSGPNNDFIFAAVTGTPAASNPAIPATPSNAIMLAVVLITGGQANLNTAGFFDRRPLGHCEVFQVTSQALPANTATPVNFDTIEGGCGWGFNVYSVPIPGRYLVTAGIAIDRVAASYFTSVQKNGTEVKRGSGLAAPSGNANPLSVLSAVVPGCVVGDGLRITANPIVAANTLAAFGSPGLCYAAFTYIGP